MFFSTLREANQVRQAEWDTGGDITLAYAGNELAGETGELLEAVDDMLNGVGDYDAICEEMADVIICCDLLALRLGKPLTTEIVFAEPGSSLRRREAIKDILIDLGIEAGRISNTVKKQERERFGMVGARGSLDDLLRNLQEHVHHVYRLGDALQLSPAVAVATKFNKTSAKYGLATMMEEPN